MTERHLVKLLLVDDREENILAMEALLEREGVEVISARSGPEALELLLQHDVALALLDVQMPEMDGFELAELMRGTEKTRRVPIIFVTAAGRDAHRVFRGYEVGAVDFLFKPVEPVLLSHKVKTFVELHRQRLDVERLADQLRETLRVNEMFVAAVGHDLRTPLNTIVMGAQLLDREAGDPLSKQTVARMRTSATRMTGILDQLSDLARARLGGGIVVDAADANFRALADKVIEELRLAYPGRTIDVTYDDGSTTGVWDERRLGQVLANVIGNALRHGKKDSPVSVQISGKGSTLVASVHNEGEIPAEIRPHLFDPFHPSTKRAGEGLGLGLYIVHQLVTAHGGTVEITSSGDAGTTTRIELPRRAKHR